MYQIRNDEDEFEPRVTPKPASKLDCFAVPSVPEVSLIFDKPLGCRSIDRKVLHPSSAEFKGLIHRSNASPALSSNGSYAAWKEENYSWRPPNSTVNNRVTPQKVQSSRNYIAETYSPENTAIDALKESIGRNYTPRKDVYNSARYTEQRIPNRIADNSSKRNYETCENKAAYMEKRQNIRTQCGKPIKHVNVASPVPRNINACTNGDRYFAANEQEYSPLSYDRKLRTCNSEQQKVSFNDPVNEPSVQNLTANPSTLKTNEFQLPHYVGQPYPYFNVNAYPFPQLHPCPTYNTESQDTMKNLLQIINSQSDQIKSLQGQVNRLLRMQEESFKERKTCSCLSQLPQNGNVFANSNDDAVRSYVREPEEPKRNVYQNGNSGSRSEENSDENEGVNYNEPILPETQSRKTFMEQKVSIGVMTSFEFTVQNSPFAVDIDDYEKKDSQQKNENLKICNNAGLCDSSESLRRYKNSFARVPSAQLENIVEDSESYMSSSQQQSSNLNASASMKDSERQASIDARRETDPHRYESPKVCKDVSMKLNKTENDRQQHSERINKGVKDCEIVKTPAMQKKAVDYNVPGNTSRKANVPTRTEQYGKVNIERDNDSVPASNSVNSSTEYYKDYKKSGQATVTKRASCIEDSLILNGGDLRINERPPTPEPSIHVDMHEYSSDDDSEKVKRSSKVGWTFYNNVLGQVNQLLQNSCVVDDDQQDEKKGNQNERDETDNRAVMDTVKVATLEQLKKLGISLSENPERKESNNSNKMAFDLSFYPRLDYQANMTQTTSAVNETNTSMHMKALALKYLTDEQLAEVAVQRQGSASVKHLMLSNVQGTNMSFATMRYLERYQLLPGKNNVQAEDIGKVQVQTPPKADLKFTNPKSNPTLRFPFNQTPRTTCPSKILDISTLKQQPKLL